jgi:hypothetical protein
MRRLSVFLAAIGVAILTFDHLSDIQHWVINNSVNIAENNEQVSVDSMNGLPVLGFILLALAAFLGGIYHKKSVFTWAGVTFLIIVIGYLFKIMQWPGTDVLMTISFGFFIIIIIPWFTAFLMIRPVPPEKTTSEDIVKTDEGQSISDKEKKSDDFDM